MGLGRLQLLNAMLDKERMAEEAESAYKAQLKQQAREYQAQLIELMKKVNLFYTLFSHYSHHPNAPVSLCAVDSLIYYSLLDSRTMNAVRPQQCASKPCQPVQCACKPCLEFRVPATQGVQQTEPATDGAGGGCEQEAVNEAASEAIRNA